MRTIGVIGLLLALAGRAPAARLVTGSPCTPFRGNCDDFELAVGVLTCCECGLSGRRRALSRIASQRLDDVARHAS